MAWTTPRTWTTGEVVTAALLNAQIKANMDLSAPAIMTTAGDIIYASGANTPARLAKDTNSTRVLTNTGTSNVPAWAQVTLTSGVTGTLPVGNGGTGATTLTDGGIILGSGTAAVTAMSVLADGEIVVGDGSTDPVALAAFSSSTGTLKVASGGTGASSLTDKAVLISQDSGTDTVGSVALTSSGQIIVGGSSGPAAATITAGTNVTITNGDGSISIAAAGGGSLILIMSREFSGDSELIITGLDSTYDTYLVQLADLDYSSGIASAGIRLGDSSGIDSGASDYSYHVRTYQATTATSNGSVSTGDSEIEFGSWGPGNADGEGLSGYFFINQPGDAEIRPTINGQAGGWDNGTNFFGNVMYGGRNAVITVDRFSFVPLAGTITSGRMTVWGLAHA